MNLSAIARKAERLLANNSPAILTAIGVVGTLTTAYLTGRASFKAAEIINLEEINQPKGWEEGDIPLKEKVGLVWKLYIPAAGTAALTVASVILANRIGTRRAAAMAAAFSLSERAFEEYKTKVIEKIGEKKEQQVRDEIAQDRLDRDPVSSREVVIAGDGNVLCYDSYTGRYFNSTMETLRKAQNDINHQVIHDHYASLSDFFDKIGLSQTKLSEEVGWNLDQMLELDISAGMSDDSRPCLVVSFEVSPARNYFRCL
jgi:hypothetical protein